MLPDHLGNQFLQGIEGQNRWIGALTALTALTLFYFSQLTQKNRRLEARPCTSMA